MSVVTPPLRAVAEPSAPRLGPKFDDTEPYHRRRSSRLKSARTPSPGHQNSSNQSNKHQSRNYQARHNLSPPSSPISPDLSLPKRKSKRDVQKKLESGATKQHTVLDDVNQMLPSPIKTPAKKDTKRVAKSTTSRVIFPNNLSNSTEDIMPKRSRISVYSPGSAPAVDVYADVSAQIPKVDLSEENVFYDLPHKRTARAKARSKAMETTEQKREALEEEHDRDKGLWYMFRGKKVFRKYDEDEEDEAEPLDTTDNSRKRQVTPPPRFVKTAYKPRTLFPEAYKKGDTTDEEAVTDIEHPEKYSSLFVSKDADKPVSTPAKQRFYATPPTTVRTTRSTAARRPADAESLDVDELSTSLFVVKKGGRSNRFDEWDHAMEGQGEDGSQDKKRKADEGSNPESKRARNGVSE